MSEKQPEALRLAGQLESGRPVTSSAAAELRRQHHEIERLNAALKWEQDRSERVGTHGPGCHLWGHRHYECLLRVHQELLEALQELRYATTDKAEQMADAAIAKSIRARGEA